MACDAVRLMARPYAQLAGGSGPLPGATTVVRAALAASTYVVLRQDKDGTSDC